MSDIIYNYKSVDYGNGVVQHRFYDAPQHTGFEKEKKEKSIYEFSDTFKKTSDLLTEEEKKNHSLYVSMNRSRDMIYQYALSNNWDFFFTLTFDPVKVDSFDYDLCLSKIRTWFNNLHKRQAPSLKYLCVPEQHKSGRWHFHALVSNLGSLILADSGHKTYGNIIYNVPQFKWGFTTATAVKDTKKVSSYLCKYITKDLCVHTVGKRRYFASKNLNLPVVKYDLIPSHVHTLLQSEMALDALYVKQSQIPYSGTTITYITIDESCSQ